MLGLVSESTSDANASGSVGLVGRNNGGTITNSFNTGSVTNNGAGDDMVG